MANKFLTMLDIAKINGSDAAVGLIEENLNIAPEATMFPARSIAGVSFKTLMRTALPTTQFRGVNTGVETTKSSYENKLVECFYLDGQMELDVAAAQADEMGEAHALALEADGHAQAAILKIGKQVWYGSTSLGDALGFPGAQQTVADEFTLNRAGSTSNKGSSVYGVKLGDKNVSLIFGRDTVLNVGDWRKQTVQRNSKEMTAWKNSLEGWVGCQWVNKNALCCAKNFTEQTDKDVTDAVLAELLSKLNWVPDFWFMSRRSRFQLQKSRTPTTVTAGNLQMAPLPVESNGIPIVVTDSILNTEAIR